MIESITRLSDDKEPVIRQTRDLVEKKILQFCYRDVATKLHPNVIS